MNQSCLIGGPIYQSWTGLYATLQTINGLEYRLAYTASSRLQRSSEPSLVTCNADTLRCREVVLNLLQIDPPPQNTFVPELAIRQQSGRDVGI
jgi:hypothetical protein